MNTQHELSRRPTIALHRVVLCALVVAGVLAVRAATPPVGARPLERSSALAQSPALLLVSRTPDGGSGAGFSGDASVSGDGQRVAFTSAATDLVASDTNGATDVFLRDGATGALALLNVDANGAPSPARALMPDLSDDGRWLVFRADADLTATGATRGGIYRRDVDTGALRLVAAADADPRGAHDDPVVSADGRLVAFVSTSTLAGVAPGGTARAMVWDASTGTLRRVPTVLDPTERIEQVAISGDGRVLALVVRVVPAGGAPSDAAAQVFVLDLARLDVDPAPTVELVSVAVDAGPGNGNSMEPTLSFDGGRVAFTSVATDLVDEDINGVSDVFLRDRATARTTAITEVVPDDNVYHPGDSAEPSLSADGERLAFASLMHTLTAGDRNSAWDIFVHDIAPRRTIRVSLREDGGESVAGSWAPSLSGDGTRVAFTSLDPLVTEDGDEEADVYLLDLEGVHEPRPAATHPPHPTSPATASPTASSEPPPGAGTATATATPHGPPSASATAMATSLSTITAPAPHPTASGATATPAHPTAGHPTATATPHGAHPTVTPTTPHGAHPTATTAPGHASPTSDPHGARGSEGPPWRLYLPRLVRGPASG